MWVLVSGTLEVEMSLEVFTEVVGLVKPVLVVEIDPNCVLVNRSAI